MIPTMSLHDVHRFIDTSLGVRTRSVSKRVVVQDLGFMVPGRPTTPRYKTEIVEERTEQWTKLVGVLFCAPSSKTAKDEILPSLDYFHHRSGQFVDFFCVGYGTHPGDGPDESRPIPVSVVDNAQWRFSAQEFNKCREEFECLTKWRFSGETDLILVVARKSRSGEATLDYSCAIVCNLEGMLRDQAIPSVRSFFEKLCQFGEQFAGSDPVWKLSDKLGVQSAKDLLEDAVLTLLPETVRKRYKAAKHFSVSNVAR